MTGTIKTVFPNLLVLPTAVSVQDRSGVGPQAFFRAAGSPPSGDGGTVTRFNGSSTGGSTTRKDNIPGLFLHRTLFKPDSSTNEVLNVAAARLGRGLSDVIILYGVLYHSEPVEAMISSVMAMNPEMRFAEIARRTIRLGDETKSQTLADGTWPVLHVADTPDYEGIARRTYYFFGKGFPAFTAAFNHYLEPQFRVSGRNGEKSYYDTTRESSWASNYQFLIEKLGAPENVQSTERNGLNSRLELSRLIVTEAEAKMKGDRTHAAQFDKWWVSLK